MEKKVRFGMELEHLRDNSYAFSDVANFINGKTKNSYYFDRLKPLFDEYGYTITIDAIKEISKMVSKDKDEQEPKEAEDNKGETEHE